MKKLSLADWGHIAEIFGAVAVVVSLVYVGMQLKQNTEAIQAQTAQMVLATYADYQFAIIGEEALSPLMIKADTGEELTAEEARRLNVWAHLLIGNWERTYRSFQSGLMDEKDWRSWDVYFRDALELSYVMDAWVTSVTGAYELGFTRYVNEEVLVRRE